MKVNNLTIVGILNTLNDFSEKKLPQKISYAITRNLMIVAKEYDVYDKQREKLFKEYSQYMIKDENGNVQTDNVGIPIVEESVAKEFREQVYDLLNIELDINLYKIGEKDIFDYDNKGIYDPMSAKDIIRLQSILCDLDGDLNSDLGSDSGGTSDKNINK